MLKRAAQHPLLQRKRGPRNLFRRVSDKNKRGVGRTPPTKNRPLDVTRPPTEAALIGRLDQGRNAQLFRRQSLWATRKSSLSVLSPFHHRGTSLSAACRSRKRFTGSALAEVRALSRWRGLSSVIRRRGRRRPSCAGVNAVPAARLVTSLVPWLKSYSIQYLRRFMGVAQGHVHARIRFC